MEHIRQLCSQLEFGLISQEEWAKCMCRLVPDPELRIMYVEELVNSDSKLIESVSLLSM